MNTSSLVADDRIELEFCWQIGLSWRFSRCRSGIACWNLVSKISLRIRMIEEPLYSTLHIPACLLQGLASLWRTEPHSAEHLDLLWVRRVCCSS